MATIDGLLALALGVERYFAANAILATVGVGLQERSFALNQGPGGASRVVLIDGDFDGSEAPRVLDGGALNRATRSLNLNPRELAQWERLITVSIWGVDYSSEAALRDTRKQIAAASKLLERTIQALHCGAYADANGDQANAGLADLVWQKIRITHPPVEMGFGQEYLLTLVHREPLFDAPVGIAFPDPAIARIPSS